MLVQIISVDNAVNCAIGLGGGLPGHPGDYRYQAGAVPAERLGGRAGSPGPGAELAGGARRAAARVRQGPDHDAARATCSSPSTAAAAGTAIRWRATPELVARRRRGRGALGASAPAATTASCSATDGRRRTRRRPRRCASGCGPSGCAAAEPAARSSDERLDPASAEGTSAASLAYGRARRRRAALGCAPSAASRSAPISGNYKDGAARLERAPQEVDPEQYLDPAEFCDDAYVIRQYLCPSCGLDLATELCRPDDPPVLDVRIDGHPR